MPWRQGARRLRTRHSRGRRAATFCAAAALLGLGTAFYVTSEPAPRVLIRWRDGVTDGQRSGVTRRFGLVRPHEADGSAVMYDLVDTRPANIQELLEQPEIVGSGYFDDRSRTVSGDALPGERRTWIAQQLVVSPELRVYRVVPGILAVCGVVLAWALAAASRAGAARARRRARALVRWTRLRGDVGRGRDARTGPVRSSGK